MNAILISICGLVILLAFEIRHAAVIHDIATLIKVTQQLEEEIVNLRNELKLKKNVYEESGSK